LVTNQIAIPANAQLRFQTKTIQSGIQGSLFDIKISTTSQTNPASFTTIQSWDEATLTATNNVFEEKIIDLSNYPAGTLVYIAFVMTNDFGDTWVLDNVNVVCKCPKPIAPLDTTYVSSTSAKLSWGNPGGISQWQIEVVPSSNSFTGVPNYTNVPTNPFTVTGLTPNTGYRFQVRSICSNGFPSDWTGVKGFSTSQCLSFIPNPVFVRNGTTATFNWQGTITAPILLEYTTLQGTVTQVSIPANTSSPYILTGLNVNQVYNFRIKANYPTPEICDWIRLTNIDSNCRTLVDSSELLKNMINTIILRINNNTTSLFLDQNSTESINLLQPFLPYINVPNPKLYNFTYTANKVSFSFSQNATVPDVTFFYHPCMGNLMTLNLVDAINDFAFQNIKGIFTLSGTNGCSGINNQFSFKNINFCIDKSPVCVLTNPRSQEVKTKLIALLNKINQLLITNGSIPNGTSLVELNILSEFVTLPGSVPLALYAVAGAPANSPFNFSFSFAPNSSASISFSNLELYQQGVTVMKDIKLHEKNGIIFDSSHIIGGIEYWFTNNNNRINNINFCPPAAVYCTPTNPNSQVVAKLAVKLLQCIIAKANTQTDLEIEGSYPPELKHLEYYISDINPKIYNFHSTRNLSNQLTGFSFSFSKNATTPNIIVNGGNFNTLNTTNYTLNVSSYQNSEVGITIGNGCPPNTIPCIKDLFINHIEFCPDDLYCKKHIAIVVDESGSISETEAAKIRTQLKNFVRAQAQANIDSETNTFVSLIGLSNQDVEDPLRTDHIFGTERISPSNINSYINWINNYRLRYNVLPTPLHGVSKNSDYWSSGLQRALDKEADIVILITDGCQVVDETTLKNVMKQFDNNPANFSPQVTYKPHLYVIGIENGYYIDATNSLNRTSESNRVNPNDDSAITRETSETERSEGYLKKSLKYLFNSGQQQFPTFAKYDFTKDYYSQPDFKFLKEEKDYLYNTLEKSQITCGEPIPVEKCDNCIGYQPEAGKEYLLTAWVKQERKDQTLNYSSTDGFIGIKLEFRKVNDDGSTDTDSAFALNPINNIECGIVSENIIEGWQRIFKKFKVPEGIDIFEIKLINNDNSIPLYFDDIRIHPIDGSMKSFVYDAETYKLMSELDENNYATFYEYDKEGGLIRVKKETSKGIKTIQETRSGNVIKE
jgi:hypothetical protein